VARAAASDGVATRHHDNLIPAVHDAMWQAVYPERGAEGGK
jgi:malate dehydrogenase (oxaloacetate-decarboxylating)